MQKNLEIVKTQGAEFNENLKTCMKLGEVDVISFLSHDAFEWRGRLVVKCTREECRNEPI